ncbi:hypothetical protein Dimus_000688 [Dionaea muscipula]
MLTASSPSNPNASDDLPNAASLAIMILPPSETSSNPASNIHSSSNASPSSIRHTEIVRWRTRSTQDADILANYPFGYVAPGIANNLEWRKPRDHVEVDLFDNEITLENALTVKINDGEQWDVADLIIPNLLIEAGLATAPAAVSSSSQESPHPPSPGHNDPSSSSESDDDPNASESEDDSDESSPNSLSLRSQPHEPTCASLSEGANSSLSHPLYPSSVTDPDAGPFTQVEDPADNDVYVDIIALDDTGLGADVAGSGAVGIEVEGIAGSGVEVTG